MPSRKGVVATLANMLDSDESGAEEMNNSLTDDSPRVTAKKGRKRKPASKRLSGPLRKSRPAASRPAESKLQPSGEDSLFSNTQDDSLLEADERVGRPNASQDTGQPAETRKPKRGRPAKTTTGQAAETNTSLTKPTQQKRKAAEVVTFDEETNPPKRRAGRPKKTFMTEPGSEDNTEGYNDGSDTEVTNTRGARGAGSTRTVSPNTLKQPANNSVTRGPSSPRAKRKKDAPSLRQEDVDEGEADPSSIRRQLQEMTEKFDAMHESYQQLQEIGIKEAEANFDLLMEKTKIQEKTANEFISSLKKELASARKEFAEAKKLQIRLDKAEEQCRESEENVTVLENEAATMRKENKNLQTKLAAARHAAIEAQTTQARVPGSAVKGKMKADPNAAQAVIAALKEDLYSDLTGMIIRDVDHSAEVDVFDCIQTGRNGTLHFHLAVDKSDPGASYEDTEFHYRPLIDEQRDGELLEILPDYLGGEIDFPRSSAVKFFSRIWDSLTRKLD